MSIISKALLAGAITLGSISIAAAAGAGAGAGAGVGAGTTGGVSVGTTENRRRRSAPPNQGQCRGDRRRQLKWEPRYPRGTNGGADMGATAGQHGSLWHQRSHQHVDQRAYLGPNRPRPSALCFASSPNADDAGTAERKYRIASNQTQVKHGAGHRSMPAPLLCLCCRTKLLQCGIVPATL